MRRLLLASAFSALLATSAAAQQPVVDGIQPSPNNYDPIGVNGLSVNATQVQVTAIGTTGAVSGSLPAVAAKTNYICGFSIDAEASAAATVVASITGMLGGTSSYIQGVNPAASGATAQLYRTFTPCIPGAAVNTAITVASGAAGTAGNTTVNIWGFVR